MKIKELIEELSKYNPEYHVTIEITEPYDEEPVTLTEDIYNIRQEHDIIILS